MEEEFLERFKENVYFYIPRPNIHSITTGHFTPRMIKDSSCDIFGQSKFEIKLTIQADEILLNNIYFDFIDNNFSLDDHLFYVEDCILDYINNQKTYLKFLEKFIKEI